MSVTLEVISPFTFTGAMRRLRNTGFYEIYIVTEMGGRPGSSFLFVSPPHTQDFFTLNFTHNTYFYLLDNISKPLKVLPGTVTDGTQNGKTYIRFIPKHIFSFNTATPTCCWSSSCTYDNNDNNKHYHYYSCFSRNDRFSTKIIWR